jgi:hypothetical protein
VSFSVVLIVVAGAVVAVGITVLIARRTAVALTGVDGG